MRHDIKGSPTFCQPPVAGKQSTEDEITRLWIHAMNSSPQAQMPIVASARWCEATKSTLTDAVESHAAIEAQLGRLNEQVKDLYKEHQLSGQRCTSLTQECATKLLYHGELFRLFGKG